MGRHGWTERGSEVAQATDGAPRQYVQTVEGPVPLDELGVTLMHEHLLCDNRAWWQPPAEAGDHELAHGPVTMDKLGRLRMDPFASLDNVRLTDVEAMAREAAAFAALGGRTLVEQTVHGIGRDVVGLRRIARLTGLRIVSGTGYYLEPSHPPEVAAADPGWLEERMLRDLMQGDPEFGIRAGLVGEIGVGQDFTPQERKCLVAAARAHARARVPLSVHLPGWKRRGMEVLDAVEAAGGRLDRVILDHMNPSGEDLAYQEALARRGAFLEYDMVGMDFYYRDQAAQSPCDEANARAILRLADRGFADQVLVSQDTFVKIQLKSYGGFGYDHILRNFVPRLRRHGADEALVRRLLVDNPRRAFTW
jgi:phosphotriesterase-related protein